MERTVWSFLGQVAFKCAMIGMFPKQTVFCKSLPTSIFTVHVQHCYLICWPAIILLNSDHFDYHHPIMQSFWCLRPDIVGSAYDWHAWRSLPNCCKGLIVVLR